MAPRFPLIPVPGPPQPADKWDWIGDKFGTYAIQMSFVHNCIIRSINNMHTYAPFVQPNTPQAASFVAYILLVIQFIREHREGEEEVIIPFLQTKFDVQETVEAQSAFAKSIDAFEGHLKKVQNNEEGYDEKRVLDLVETFGDVLVDHLNHMIGFLSTTDEFLAMNKRAESRMKFTSFTCGLVFIMTHHDFAQVPD